MRIPILTYHAADIAGNSYGTNDVLALASDLRTLRDRGFSIWPLHRTIAAWLGNPRELEGRRIACLTCDDGTDFDFRDLEHPSFGPQRSMYNVLADFAAAHPGAKPHITSFVVVS